MTHFWFLVLYKEFLQIKTKYFQQGEYGYKMGSD